MTGPARGAVLRALGILAAAVFLAVGQPRRVAAQHLDARAVRRIVDAQQDSGFRGVVLVAAGDSVLASRAVGSRVRVDSPFWIGSITKSFTAAAVLGLARDGLLSLDDSIGRFFPDAPVDTRPLTIRELLTHTAGLAQRGAGFGVIDPDSAARAILAGPLAYLPGAGYRYGDDDYALLALIVERVTGLPWSTAIHRGVLAPAGLWHTEFWCGGTRGVRARRCSSGGDYGHRGANGMASTAADLLRWSRWIASTPWLADIETPEVRVRREGSLDVAYGFGARLYVRDGRVVEVFHSGRSDHGNSAVVRRLATGVTIVVLSDAGMHGGTTWASYVASRLAPRAGGNAAPRE